MLGFFPIAFRTLPAHPFVLAEEQAFDAVFFTFCTFPISGWGGASGNCTGRYDG